ncbi:hypothetical protein TRFO_21716 [Tritrichomonas foetus]|uniref:Uncharacterized protein n=1 Tax=Tritrichomonas foetus TaxID=1144522 RepID=A0A1J4KD83_9EUKA|nr:hypothetical protein TRFO_21716 [Tritrichomonas foetus]|eukprot:OHT09393.1 hypothetical protein TRFO_21716 [Tritrichomonas foetus]
MTLSPPERKLQNKIVNDDKKEQRLELRKKASILQKYVHFEASMKPHLIKLTKDIDELVKQCDEIETSIASLQKSIEKEKQQQNNNETTDEDRSAREAKIQEIKALEQDLQRLLREKAKYLSRAENKMRAEQ